MALDGLEVALNYFLLRKVLAIQMNAYGDLVLGEGLIFSIPSRKLHAKSFVMIAYALT